MKKHKYSWLELLFADRWQWVRKRSKALWVMKSGNGHGWVKFYPHEIELYSSLGYSLNPKDNDGYVYEDYR